jgi:hypothetical protein
MLKTALTAALFLSTAASAQNPAAQAILAERLQAETNRIVGLWSSRIDIGPCAGGPRQQLRGLNQFHLGGTLTETGTPPPGTRGPGYGVWRFNRATQRYEARMQFLRYLPDGSFDGFSDVHRELRLSDDGNVYIDEIVARLLNPDDSLRVELCGTAEARRVPIL